MEKTFYNVKQVAKMLQVSEPFVRKLIAHKSLACYRMGKTIKVTEDDLEKFLHAIYQTEHKGEQVECQS